MTEVPTLGAGLPVVTIKAEDIACEPITMPSGWALNRAAGEARRKETTRLQRFWCGIRYGHDRIPEDHCVCWCERCGAMLTGSD